ncbi:MAG: hypothetical protein MHMPM18_002199 [Marteilia pararefringens]
MLFSLCIFPRHSNNSLYYKQLLNFFSSPKISQSNFYELKNRNIFEKLSLSLISSRFGIVFHDNNLLVKPSGKQSPTIRLIVLPSIELDNSQNKSALFYFIKGQLDVKESQFESCKYSQFLEDLNRQEDCRNETLSFELCAKFLDEPEQRTKFAYGNQKSNFHLHSTNYGQINGTIALYDDLNEWRNNWRFSNRFDVKQNKSSSHQLLVAHRCLSKTYDFVQDAKRHEQSQEAVEKANHLLLEAIEFDLKFSIDNKPVIYHDDTIWHRLTRSKRNISEMSSNELIETVDYVNKSLLGEESAPPQLLSLEKLHKLSNIETIFDIELKQSQIAFKELSQRRQLKQIVEIFKGSKRQFFVSSFQLLTTMINSGSNLCDTLFLLDDQDSSFEEIKTTNRRDDDDDYYYYSASLILHKVLIATLLQFESVGLMKNTFDAFNVEERFDFEKIMEKMATSSSPLNVMLYSVKACDLKEYEKFPIICVDYVERTEE